MDLRQRAFAVSCGALCGASVWSSIGVLAVDTLTGSIRIVGLAPSLAMLAIAAAAGAALAAWTASRGVPATLYLLPVVGALGWTTIVSWPALVAWAGPSVVLPFALLAIGVVISIRAMQADAAPWRLIARGADNRWSACVAAAATALWLTALLAAATSLPVTGDEPHYLLVTQSVLTDGDVNLTNNYDAETYRAFYAGLLQRHVTYGYLAEEYSFHGLGLSVLLIPGFALGGVLGSRLLIVLVTAVGAGFFWSSARRVTDSAFAAWTAWLAMISAASFALHGILLYPDGVAGTITSIALWVLARLVLDRNAHGLAVVGAGIALATLPWLHIRLSLTAGVFGLAILWALNRRRRDLMLPFLAPPIISFVLWIASTWVMFHKLDPTAAFRERATGSLAQAPLGTLGLLFDAEYGLLTYAPALAIAVLGIRALWKRTGLVAMACVVLTIGTLVIGASWVWWGGDSAPARFLAPVVPLVALCLASWLANASSSARTYAAVLIVVGACITAWTAFADGGAYILNAPDGRVTIWEWLSPNVDVSLALPSLFRAGAQPGTEAIVAAMWVGSGAIVFLLVTSWRGTQHVEKLWLQASAVVIVWLTAGASVAWLLREGTPWTPDRGQLRMLYAGTSPALSRGLHGAGWPDADRKPAPAHFTTRESALSSLSISMPWPGTTTRLHVPFVPAGRYAIEVERPTSTLNQPATRLSLTLGRTARAQRWFVTRSAEAQTFSLALPVWSVHVETDSLSDAPTTVRLRPEQVFAPAPFPNRYALSATIDGPINLYRLDDYLIDAGQHFEIAMNRETSLFVTDAKGSPLSFVVQIETATPGATATVTHGTFQRTAPVHALNPERFDVAAQSSPLLPVHIYVSGQPRPYDGRPWVRIFSQ